MRLEYIVEPENEGKPVRFILKQKLHLSERLVKRLKYSGKITVNSAPARVVDLVSTGDSVSVDLDIAEECPGIIAQQFPIDIIFEDEWLIAVNKRPGIVVHPTMGHPEGTVANALAHHYASNGEAIKIRPVSRLDRDTSGLIIFAKNQFVQDSLTRQMHSGSFRKTYHGIVHGNMKPDSGTIDLPIERMPGSIMLRHVTPEGARSVTHYNVLEHFSEASFLTFRLETGRTHQIRVHCQAAGHSLAGDSLYPPINHRDDCPLCSAIGRQALHSSSAGFIHPYTGKTMELAAPLPEDISGLLEILRK